MIHRTRCQVCLEDYDDSDPIQERIHQHSEPQQGRHKAHWIRTGLCYERWALETESGREWLRMQVRLNGTLQTKTNRELIEKLERRDT
jgi:hypothetical protein